MRKRKSLKKRHIHYPDTTIHSLYYKSGNVIYYNLDAPDAKIIVFQKGE